MYPQTPLQVHQSLIMAPHTQLQTTSIKLLQLPQTYQPSSRQISHSSRTRTRTTRISSLGQPRISTLRSSSSKDCLRSVVRAEPPGTSTAQIVAVVIRMAIIILGQLAQSMSSNTTIVDSLRLKVVSNSSLCRAILTHIV